MTNTRKIRRRSGTDLLRAGLTILARHGEAALTIDSICKKLGVTKGSFYHHFGSREAFSRRLLEYWETEHTRRFIEISEQERDAEGSFRALDALALEMDDDIEVAIRAWALRDPLARSYQERVDAMRMAHLQKLHQAMVGDADQAALLAQLEYAAFVGARQIMPGLSKERIGQIIDLWTTLLDHYHKGEAS